MENNDNPLALSKVEVLDNPLMVGQSKELIISPGQEFDQKIDMLTEIDSIATITKQQLSIRRQRVELEVENKKLDTAKKIIDGMEAIAEEIIKPERIKKMMDRNLTPADFNFVASGLEKMANVLKTLMNPNVLDEMGNKKRQKINFMFKSSGGAVQGAIQVDNSNDD